MSKKSYGELLRDPRWQRKRLEILNRADFKCRDCKSGEKTLHVHHKLYRKNAMPWEYEDHELVVLCEDCHAIEHELRSALDAALAILDPPAVEMLVGYAEAEAAKLDCMDTILIRSWYHGFGVCDSFRIKSQAAFDEVTSTHGHFSVERLHALYDLPSEGTG